MASEEPPPLASRPLGFETARGSTYEMHPDGTTTRNKAARTDPGHEGDFGPKARSEATYFLEPQGAQRLAPPQGAVRVIDHGNGTLSLATLNGNTGQWGVAPSQHQVPFSTTPRVGAVPLEVWRQGQLSGLPAYSAMHFGNPIVNIQGGRVDQGPSAMVANSAPARLAIVGELEKLEADRADHQTRVGQTDNWGYDYADRQVKTLGEQIARRQHVLGQMAQRTQFDFPGVEPRVIVPAEAGEGIRENSDWNSGGALRWSQPNGATVRGIPIDVDDPRVPDTLYHATTNLPGVQATGMLRAGGVGGLGGDAADNMVSMTTSPEIAEGIARDLRTAATISRMPTPTVTETHSRTMSNGQTYQYETSEWTSPEAGQEYQARVIAALQQQARTEGWEYTPEFISEHAQSGDLLRAYFSTRSYQAGIQNPTLMTDRETLARIDPDKVGVLQIPKDALRTGALLTDFDLGRRGLEEIRSYGDVPLVGGVPLQGRPPWSRARPPTCPALLIEMPTNPDFERAVRASPFARMTQNGLEIDLERWQHPNQMGEESVRGGVFYLPRRRTPSPYRGISPAR